MKSRHALLPVLFGLLLLPAASGRGEPGLASVKKGNSEGRSWVVLGFDQKAIWSGLSTDAGKTALYFLGKCGENDGASMDVDPESGISISISKVSDSPSVMKVAASYSNNTPITVLKSNRNVMIRFNDAQFLEDKKPSLEDVSVTPGQLLDFTSATQNGKFNVSLPFRGSYDWVGFTREASGESTIWICGVQSAATKSAAFPGQDIASLDVSFNRDIGCLHAKFFASPSVPVTIARRPDRLIIQTNAAPAGNHSSEIRAAEASPVETSALSTLAEPIAAPVETKPMPVRTRLMASRESMPAESVPIPAEAEKIPAAESKSTPVVSDDGISWDSVVSFQFNNTPLKSAFRTLARSGGVNMVIDDGIKGTVTMNLENVTLRQALDMLAHTHQCDYIVEGKIITVKGVATTYSGGRITKVYHLKYADAENVASVVRRMTTTDSLVEVFHPEFLDFNVAGKNRMAKNEVSVQGIRRSSILVVTDRPEKIREIDQVILQLDIEGTQIMIESKLVEITPSYNDQLGIDWDKTITAVLRQQDALAGGDYTDYSVVNTNPGNGGAFKLGHLSASQFQVVLDFLREKTDSKMISQPKLLAMDNEESSISVGTTVPVARIQRGMGGQGDMVTFDYKEVNIQLNVTPHVRENNEITMYVNPVIEEITGWVNLQENSAPITNKRAVNSIVSVANGETVVIGGLNKNQKVQTTSRVWLLGSIPLLGRLFQHEKIQDTQTELLIFITPSIIKG
jgi:type IV pilus secretin PilQ/predicted competence protein